MRRLWRLVGAGGVATALLVGCVGPQARPAAPASGDGQVRPTSAPSRPPIAAPTRRPAGFHVSDLTVRADPFTQTTVCPAVVTFTGRITADGGAGRVVYQWVNSDTTASVSPPVTLVFEHPDTIEVVSTLTLGQRGRTVRGWQAIEVLQPQRQLSERASFTLACLR